MPWRALFRGKRGGREIPPARFDSLDAAFHFTTDDDRKQAWTGVIGPKRRHPPQRSVPLRPGDLPTTRPTVPRGAGRGRGGLVYAVYRQKTAAGQTKTVEPPAPSLSTRPAMPEEKTIPMSVRLPVTLHEQMVEETRKTGESQSDLLRRFTRDALNHTQHEELKNELQSLKREVRGLRDDLPSLAILVLHHLGQLSEDEARSQVELFLRED
jgi:hypothetical protein